MLLILMLCNALGPTKRLTLLSEIAVRDFCKMLLLEHGHGSIALEVWLNDA